MKVYVKKGEKTPMFPGILVTIIFLAVSTYIFISVFTFEGTFLDLLAAAGVMPLFGIIFSGFGIYFVIYIIKRPKSYKAKLVSKQNEIYNGKQITYMQFRVPEDGELEDDSDNSDYSEYDCYTIGENNLIVENEYALKVKEFNWQPRYVEELSSNSNISLNKRRNPKNKVASKVPKKTLSPVLIMIGLIFIGMLFLCILGLIIYPEDAFEFIAVIFISSAFIYGTFKVNKACKSEDKQNQNENELNLELEKIKPLRNVQERVGNIVIKHLCILILVFSLAWLLITLSLNLDKQATIIIYSMILLPATPLILMILFNIGYDKRLIKKHNVTITENINIANTRVFNIFRPTKNVTFPQYFIIDEKRNLLLKIKKGNFIGTKYAICNQNDIKIGEIELNLFSITNEFKVNMMDESPFIIRSKLEHQANYQVIGRDYYIKGDTNLISNIIYDNKDNEIAYISAISKHNNNWHELGNTETILNNGVNNSIDIMLISLCITIGNFQTFYRQKNR